MKFVAKTAVINNPGNRGEAIQSNAGKGRNSANFALITFAQNCKMTHSAYHLRTNASSILGSNLTVLVSSKCRVRSR